MQLYTLFCWLTAVTMAKCTSRSFLNGVCPQPPVKADFELEKYLGTWYEVEKNPTVFQSGQKCTSATYTLKDNGKVTVFNKAAIAETGDVTTIEGEAYIPDPSEPAKLLVSFPGNPFDSNYWILDTDYEKYSVVFSCQGILGVFRIESDTNRHLPKQ
ncbi:apolipoprotein D-like isoform X2 [Tachypleus tridentatus]|uniref:apolipoprotein D-like isoform X2 n=1 Tax=Tachypleus tridentatus TaxID=6853 RepID=UPI003FD680DD